MKKKNLGAQLADARKAYGMSQEELGEAVGAAGRTISTWETGVHQPTRRVQATLEALYGWPAGSISYAIRTGAELPPITTAFTPRPSPAAEPADETARARAARNVADALELLSDRVRELEDRVQQIESSRGRRQQRTS